MRSHSALSRLALCALFLCVGMLGCTPSFPYYTTEGSMESREVHVYVSETEIIEVPCGLGGGGGLGGKIADENNIITVEQDGVVVKIKMETGGATPVIVEVTYNGEKLIAHEEVL